MNYISRCIDSMLERGSDGLVLMAGKQPVMRIEGKAQAISSTAVTEADLGTFLTDALALPPAALAAEAPETFSYQGAASPVMIRKARIDGVLSLQITPAKVPVGAGAPAAAPTTTPTASIPTSAAAPAAAPSAPVPTPAVPPPATAAAQAAAPAGRINELLIAMVTQGASDLHLCTGVPPFLRKDGQMVALPEEPFTDEQLHAVLMAIIPERNRVEYAENCDTDFGYEIPGQARFRCNYFRDRKGCGAVFRQIPVEILSTKQLGLPDQLLRLCNLTKGLVLVTGPTGSGKSTTLAALIDHINKTRDDHIITIEDPIEFVHQNHKCLVNQREVNVHTKGFRQALRAALREDPDIVLIGEMRDLETISIAIETAETGHLVFGTLHTTTAVSTIDRIIDQFPADQQGQIRVMLSESMRGVISQTLCKKKGGGRVAALEVMLYTRAIGNLIREGKTFQIPSAIQTGKKEGMMLLNDSLVKLVGEDKITADEAYMRSVDKDGIQPLLMDKGLTIGV
jgi:twitching motility protein PilT